MSADSWAELGDKIDAENSRIVMQDTWGHLAPEKDKEYRGRIVWSVGAYGEEISVLVTDIEGLPGSPWYCQAEMDFLIEFEEHKEGCVYEWKGVFKNYKFKGTRRLIYDANA